MTDIDTLEQEARQMRARMERLEQENAALRAEREALEGQEAVAWLVTGIRANEDVAVRLIYNDERRVAERGNDGPRITPLYARPVPAPASVPAVTELMPHSTVPDDYRNQATGYRAGWNDCRRTMLAAAPKPEGE